MLINDEFNVFVVEYGIYFTCEAGSLKISLIAFNSVSTNE